jgi:hypothetical protein
MVVSLKESHLEATVDLAVVHHIHDPQGWKRALEDYPEPPADFNLRSFVEASDGTRAFCLWEAPSQAALQEELDRTLGPAAVNEVIPVRVNHFEGRVEPT